MIPKKAIASVLDAYPYPADAKEELLSAFDLVCEREDFLALLDIYSADVEAPFQPLLEGMKAVSAAVGIHEYTGAFVLMLSLIPRLAEEYRARDISFDILRDTLADLYYKILECRAIYNVNGSSVAHWQSLIFRMRLYAFERLQFEPILTQREITADGITLPIGTKAFSVHIPRTLTPMDHDAVLRSYAAADAFIRSRGMAEETIFVCGSWLLFPRHREMLRPTSNIVRFLNDFTLYDSGFSENYSELWRLFDMPVGDIDALPADTSLRRAYIDLMRRGEPSGFGRGVILWTRKPLL